MLAVTTHDAATTLALIVTIGVAGQWVASVARIPSVLVLLLSGLAVGPLGGLIEPTADLGPALFPAVGLAVGLLLFEGGLSLRLDKLGAARSAVLRLVTVGAAVTWLVASAAVQALFGGSWKVSGLIGAILVVSGPTVILPLLTQVRPREPGAAILRWEAIVIDPIGATLAIVMLDAAIEPSSPMAATRQILLTLGSGAVVGLIAAAVTLVALNYHAVPDRLHNPILLGFAIGAYSLANLITPEAGLMAATTLGMALANQHWVPARQIAAFSEDVAVILLGSLFVTLGALVEPDELAPVIPRSIVLLVVLAVVARPLAVWASTVGTAIDRNTRRYLATMAPRGIVAAAVATVFANELAAEPGRAVPQLVPIVFTIVIGSVAFYGLTAAWWARVTRVAKPSRTGLAIVGNHPAALEIADRLRQHDGVVLLVTSRRLLQAEAARRGVLVYDGPLDDEDLGMALEAAGIGQALLLTDDANLESHAAHHLGEHLGRARIHRVPVDETSRQDRGYRLAFRTMTFSSLTDRDARYEIVAPADVAPHHVPLLELEEGQISFVNGTMSSGTAAILVVVRPTDST
ncbi:MAG: cation:proton antiporter [Acidimicrobiales bacterium]